MNIYNRDGSVLADVWLQDSSFVYEEIMGDHSAQIDFLSRHPIDLEIGDYIEFEGNVYTLRHKESVTKRETSLGWDYSVVVYAAQYELQDVPFFLTDQPEYLKNGDYYTGTASDWLALIIKNMNREIGGWSAGACIESEWITISFKDKQCSEILDELCAKLDTEWKVAGRTLTIGRVEYPSSGFIFSQGEGGGFKELRLSSSSQERPVTVLYPYGQDKNLPENYGADYLLLPGGKKVLERNTEKYGRCGMKVQFDVYPKGEFEVTSVIDDLTFTATGIDFDIAACLIPDTEVTVSFQSGALAGYDLAIAEDGWDNSTKTIKVLQNEEENALKVPGDIHFAVGDRFALFNLRMPQSYIDKAEQELEQKAQAWLDKKSEKEVRLSAKCDDILFKQNGISIRCGQMVRILSLELDLNKEIRVTKVKRYIENEIPTYRYELTLSDFLDTNGFKQLVKDVENVPEEIKTQTKPFERWTRRSWRDVMETFEMMFDPEGDYFTELIKPLAVHTAQLIVGTNSQQMDLVGVRFIPNKEGNPNVFASTAGKLVHFTVDESGIREWSIEASEYALNAAYPYYVYAKCPRNGDKGTILCSTDKIKLEDDPDYYHFWVGVLNSPYEGSRSWNPSYGYTEISGETITTGVIKDKNGTFAINLNDGTITGWGSMTDKPDMTQYATVSWANGVFNTKVGNDEIISRINQTPESITINASKINLVGAVTYQSLNSYMKSQIDDISTIEESLGNVIANYVTQSQLGNYVSETELAGELAKYVSSSSLATSLKEYEKTGVANSLVSDMKSALVNGNTSIIGGMISTEFIDASTIVADYFQSGSATIANFTIETGQLSGGNGAGITVYKSSGGTTYQAKLGWGTRNSNGGATIFWADNASIGKLHCEEIICYDYIRDGCLFKASSGGLGVLVGGSGLSGNGIWGKNNSNTGNLYLNSGAPSSALVKITNCSCSDASDERIKTIFYDVPNVLDKLEGISAFYYTFKEDEDKILKIGVSAQAVKEVFPEAVTLIMPDSSDSYYGVNYVQLLTAVGINGLKELHAKVKALENRVAELEK